MSKYYKVKQMKYQVDSSKLLLKAMDELTKDFDTIDILSALIDSVLAKEDLSEEDRKLVAEIDYYYLSQQKI